MLSKKLAISTILLASTLSLASAASASTQGFYFGGQAGYANTNTQGFTNSGVSNASEFLTDFGIPNTATNSNKTTGLAGRLFIGYQIDPIWGVELGVTKFSDAVTKATFNSIPGASSGSVVEKITTETDAGDLVVKATMPLQNGFSIFGKAGIASVHAKSTASGSGTISAPVFGGVATDSLTGSASETENRVLPTASVGVQYDLTPKLVADLTYTRIQKTGNTDIIKSTNFVGLGLSYHFG